MSSGVQARACEMADLKKLLDEYGDRVAQVEQRCKDAVDQRDAAVAVSTTLQGVQERLTAANKALAALHMEHEGVKHKLNQKDSETADLLKQIQALTSEKEGVQQALKDEKERISRIKQDRDDIENSLRPLRAELLASETLSEELRRTIARLEALLQQKESNIQKLNVQLEHAQDQIHSQGIELLDKQDIITELERSLRSAQRTIDAQVSLNFKSHSCDSRSAVNMHKLPPLHCLEQTHEHVNSDLAKESAMLRGLLLWS